MKIPAAIPAGFCIVAGLLLAADALCSYFSGTDGPLGSANKFDVFSFAIGLYFIGKGLFIQSLLSGWREFKQNRSERIP